jgi:hypothetical protein
MEKWKAGPEVMKKVKSLIAKYHPHLALVEEDIVVVFKEKASEKAGKVIMGNTSKVTPLLPVVTDKKFAYKFIIEIGADVWQNELDDKQQLALLDHHLCAMKVDDDGQGGYKYSLRPPDFVGYKEEVERWGMWRPMDDDTLSIIEKMFGKKADEHATTVKKRTAAADPDDVDDILAALNGKS